MIINHMLIYVSQLVVKTVLSVLGTLTIAQY